MKKVAVAVLLLAAPPLAAQGPPTNAAVDRAMKAYDEGHYLAATNALAAAAFDTKGRAKDDFAFQMWEQVTPTVTNELDIATLDRAHPDAKLEPSWAEREARATPRDAITEIVKRARETRLIVLNEAHDSPRDRAFVLEVARALRPLGYSLLAAETFDNEPKAAGAPSAVARLKRDGFVRRSTGFYSRDPVFAAYLREAVAIGYEPVSYEQTSKQSRPFDPKDPDASVVAREQAEADNLAAVLTGHPGAKMLVHVGYSHVAEAAIDRSGGKVEWMAARLKRLTGIDPLTIDQTTISELWANSRPAAQAAAARIGDRPAVMFEGDRPLVIGQYEGAVDLQVVQPARRYRDGRPVWLATLGGRPIPVPARLMPAAGRRLVQVFAAAAPPDAVPLDQIIVRAGVKPPMLMVPPVPVRFATQP